MTNDELHKRIAAGEDVNVLLETLPLNEDDSAENVRLLLAAGATPSPDLLSNAMSNPDYEPLVVFAEHGFIPDEIALKPELQAYALVKAWVARGVELPLHELASVSPPGEVELLQAALDAGTDVDEADASSGWTALHWAIQHHNREAVELLLARGATVKPVKEDLYYLSIGNDPRFVRATAGELATLEIASAEHDAATGWATAKTVDDARAIAAMISEREPKKRARARLIAGEQTYATLVAGHAYSAPLTKKKLTALLELLGQWSAKAGRPLCACRPGDASSGRVHDLLVGFEIAGVDADADGPSRPIAARELDEALAAARELPAELWFAVGKICGVTTTEAVSVLLAASGPLATAVLATGEVVPVGEDAEEVVYGATMSQEPHSMGVAGERVAETDSIREMDLSSLRPTELFLIALYD